MIRPGQLARFDAAYATAVHHRCEDIVRLVTQNRRFYPLEQAHLSPWADIALPHGLRPGTYDSYSSEWSRYIDFAQGFGYDVSIPGRDASWCAHLLWRFMLFRAEHCKPSSVFSCLSALAHFGHYCRHPLPTRKEDGNALLHRDIANMKKEIAIYYCNKKGISGTTYDVAHSTPLGKSAVELLLSSLAIVNEDSFRALKRIHRHNLVASMQQHTVGMRFGHFLFREYTCAHFKRDADGAYRLVTDWHRYQGQRRYVLTFARAPRWKCLCYDVRATNGSVVTSLTTALVMQWHFRVLREAGESKVFEPVKGQRPSRAARRKWLQETLLAALPMHELAARQMITFVTPHAFRAGIASDLHEEQVPWQAIAMWCRWHSLRAMRMYASRPALHTARTSRQFRLIHNRHHQITSRHHP